MYDLNFWRKVEKARNKGLTVSETCRLFNILPATLRRARIKGFINDERRITSEAAKIKRIELEQDSDKVFEIYKNNNESVKATLEVLGLSLSPANKNCIKQIIKNHGGILHNKIRKKYTEKQVIDACKKVENFTELAHELGVSARTNNNIRFKKIIKENNIDISHWGAGSNKRKYNFDDIFCENSKIPGQQLKKYIITFNILDLSKCSQCGISEWNEQRLTIQIDHINGNNRNNRLENLRGLCPNCHSLTETYCGKRKNKHNKQEGITK